MNRKLLPVFIWGMLLRRLGLTVISAVAFVQPVIAVQPPLDFSNKPVSELVHLLDSPDSMTRQCAAIYLGLRYKNPQTVRVNEPQTNPGSLALELPIPSSVITKLGVLMRSDRQLEVRLCALAALEDLRYRTNTTPLIKLALSNANRLVRIRAAETIGRISKDYKEPLPGEVIAVLQECLESSQNPDELWQAAYAIGRLGPQAKSAILALEKLTNHPSVKVRGYVKDALEKLRP